MSSLRSKVIRLAHADTELRPYLLRLAARGTYVETKLLPDFLVRLLKSQFRFRRRSIEVIPATKVTTGGPSFEGNRSVVVTVNLGTQQSQTFEGSWGGANPFEKRQVDQRKTYQIPPNGAALQGEYGGRGSFARLYIHPSNMATLIEDQEGPELSDKAKWALAAISDLKGGQYRREEFRRHGVGDYSVENPYVQELLKAGLIKANRGGAMRVTTKGRNVREDTRHTHRV